MIFLQKDFEKIKEILLGAREKSPPVQELDDWMAIQYSVELLDVHLLPTPSKMHSADLSFILENRPEKIHQHKEEILREFRRIASIHKFASDEILNDPFVEFVDFYNEARGHIARISANEVRTSFIEKYPMIWKIQAEFSHLIVIYDTDKDITTYENNNTSDLIRNDIYSIIKKHDQLNYFSKENLQISFDSKENIDNYFGGSLFFYSRR